MVSYLNVLRALLALYVAITILVSIMTIHHTELTPCRACQQIHMRRVDERSLVSIQYTDISVVHMYVHTNIILDVKYVNAFHC